MKFISWSVNGLKSAINHGFVEDFKRQDADFFCLQRTRLDKGEEPLQIPNYYQYWNYAEKKGYSGTAIFTKYKPENVIYGMNNSIFDKEGRLITLEYPNFYLIDVYVPVSGEKLQHLDYRLDWDRAFLDYVTNLQSSKPVIIGGDMSVAYQPIDLAEPTEDHHKAGFTKQERADFGKLLDAGFTDTFRYLHPNLHGAYTWWSYRYDARERNVGWRLDYFLVSDVWKERIEEAKILSDVKGSSHCPIELVANVEI